MLAIIGYLFLATLTCALTQLAAARKTILWDCIGCIPFFASILCSVAFGIQVMDCLPSLETFADSVKLTYQILGVAFFISVGAISSYVAGGALLAKASAYAQARRQKPAQ